MVWDPVTCRSVIPKAILPRHLLTSQVMLLLVATLKEARKSSTRTRVFMAVAPTLRKQLQVELHLALSPLPHFKEDAENTFLSRGLGRQPHLTFDLQLCPALRLPHITTKPHYDNVFGIAFE